MRCLYINGEKFEIYCDKATRVNSKDITVNLKLKIFRDNRILEAKDLDGHIEDTILKYIEWLFKNEPLSFFVDKKRRRNGNVK
jgi:hypothetical protein